jgi:hypothetical protein
VPRSSVGLCRRTLAAAPELLGVMQVIGGLLGIALFLRSPPDSRSDDTRTLYREAGCLADEISARTTSRRSHRQSKNSKGISDNNFRRGTLVITFWIRARLFDVGYGDGQSPPLSGQLSSHRATPTAPKVSTKPGVIHRDRRTAGSPPRPARTPTGIRTACSPAPSAPAAGRPPGPSRPLPGRPRSCPCRRAAIPP